jgi:hypothetical protein
MPDCIRPLVVAATILYALPAAADPMLAPTVDYIADVTITRASDHSVETPARYIYGGRHIRVDLVGIVTVVDLDRAQTVTMIPRVRTYWRPVRLRERAADGRLWVGVEAQSAEQIGQETLLGRPVTKYHVRGTIFDTRTPFEGDVWTTAENIVVKVDGKTTEGRYVAPVKLSTVQLKIGPVDQRLFDVPANFGRAGADDPLPRPYD